MINAAAAENDQAPRPPWLIHTYELKQHRNSQLGADDGYEVDVDASSRELFFHELRVWFPLTHPHVIRLYGACHIGKRFFVCEFAGKGTLNEYLKHEKTKVDGAVDRSWQLLSQVALGLQYLHEHSTLHNDLKCDNVLISTGGEAKITNFGLSCILKSAEVVVDSKKRSALQWKSPEYIRDDRLTLASDIYAFGMCILEAATGSPPRGSLVDGAVRYQVLTRKSLPPRPDCLTDRHWTLIEMMCAWEPAQRV